jgi:hypothetical protein
VPDSMSNSKLAGPILHENVPLLEVADKLTMDMLLSDGPARLLILARLSDTVAVVAPGQTVALVLRLRKLGHTPKTLEH